MRQKSSMVDTTQHEAVIHALKSFVLSPVPLPLSPTWSHYITSLWLPTHIHYLTLPAFQAGQPHDIGEGRRALYRRGVMLGPFDFSDQAVSMQRAANFLLVLEGLQGVWGGGRGREWCWPRDAAGLVGAIVWEQREQELQQQRYAAVAGGPFVKVEAEGDHLNGTDDRVTRWLSRTEGENAQGSSL